MFKHVIYMIEKQADEVMKTVIQKKRANAKVKKDMVLGDMLQKTRQLLVDFYKPWNRRLVALLGKDYIDYMFNNNNNNNI